MTVKEKQNLMDIHAHIKNKQWIKTGQSVDRLTIDIANGTVSSAKLSELSKAVRQDCDRETTAFGRETGKTIADLISVIATHVKTKNTFEASRRVKQLQKIILTAHEISTVASAEGLTDIPASDIKQIGVTEGKPIYTLK